VDSYISNGIPNNGFCFNHNRPSSPVLYYSNLFSRTLQRTYKKRTVKTVWCLEQEGKMALTTAYFLVIPPTQSCIFSAPSHTRRPRHALGLHRVFNTVSTSRPPHADKQWQRQRILCGRPSYIGQWRRHTRCVGAYAPHVGKIHNFFVPDFWVI